MRTPNIIIAALQALGFKPRTEAARPKQRYIGDPNYRLPGHLSSYDHTTNQRKIRKRRRTMHAAGFKNAFN